MAKKITKDQIIDPNIFDNLIQSAKEAEQLLDTLITTQKELLKESAKVAKSLKFDENISKNIKKLNDETKKLAKNSKDLAVLEREKIKNDRELVKLETDRQRAIQATNRTRVQEAKEEERQLKIANRLKAQKEKLNSAYQKESTRLNDLRKKYRDLILSEGKATGATKKLKKEIQELDARLKKVDADVGVFNRSVGDYKQALTGSLGTLGQFATGAGAIAGGVMLLGRAFSSGVEIVKEFEQSNANLASILGVSRSEITALTEDAKRLGAETAFSASEVSGLQTEFAKLGFGQQEIINATEATLNLAAATGSDLAEAAAVAGATLGGFGLDAKETQRVTDVMAKSFSTSALDMEKFRESMKNAAPAAKAVGVSVEETTALLGTLANSGVAGSKAGNALKNTFVSLNKAGLDLEGGFEKVNNSSDKLKTAVELVGKESATAFLIMAEGVDETKALKEGLEDAGGAAEKMAKEQLDTLEGSLKILNSAWEGFVLGLLEGDGIFSSVSRQLVDLTTSILGMLTPMGEAKKTQEELNNANTETIRSSQRSQKENTRLADTYEELTAKTELTVEEKQELDDVTNQLILSFGDSVASINKETGALEINIGAVRRKILADKVLESEAAKKKLLEKSRLENLVDLGSKAGKQIDDLGKNFINLGSIFDAAKESPFALGQEINKLRGELLASGSGVETFDKQVAVFEKRLLKLSEALFFSADNTDKLNAINQEFKDLGIDIDELLTEETESLNANTEATTKNAKAKKGLSDEQKKFNEDLKHQIALLKLQEEEELLRAGEDEIKKFEIKARFLEQVYNLEKQLKGQTQKDLIILEKEFVNDKLAINLAYLKELENQEKKEQDRKKKEEKDRLKSEKEFLQEQYKEAEKDRKRRLKEQQELNKKLKREARELSEFLLELTERENKEKLDAIDSEINALSKQEEQLRKDAKEGIADAKDNLAINEKLQADAQLRRKEQIAQAKREEAGLVFLKILATKAEQGDKEPFLSAVLEFGKSKAFIDTLQGFSEGTDNTGYGGTVVDSEGKVVKGFVHEGEMVMNEDQTKALGGATRSEVIDNFKLAEKYKAGELERNYQVAHTNKYSSNQVILEGFKELKHSIDNQHKKMPSKSTSYDPIQRAIIETIKQGNKKDIYITKVGNGGILGN
jgi:hypothetical protein